MNPTRAEVLAALRRSGPAGVSGQELAERIGVSRAAVGKHVTALRESGYVVLSRPGRGYVLASAPDLPLPQEVAHLLGAGRGWVVTGREVTGSTNDDAKELARAGAPGLTAVLASRQTGGRGRLGRTWESPSGGVYLSVVLRPEIAPHEAAPLAPVCALGVARGVERLGVPEAAVKWPNDVMLEGGKLAGVLVEVSAESDALEWAVIGVGLNVRRPEVGAAGAAYLAEAPGGQTVRLPEAAAALLECIVEAVADMEAGGFGSLRTEYEGRMAFLGAAAVVRDRSGATVASGSIAGVDDEARLLLRDAAGGTRAVTAGEVTLR